MRIFFIADTHFGHGNIIAHTGRPFHNASEMDAFMIEKWNGVVDKNDTVFHLGDFCMGGWMQAKSYFSKLNGNIIVVTSPSHHDKRWVHMTAALESASGWPVVVMNHVHVLFARKVTALKSYPRKVILYHFPIAVWEDKHYGSWHLHGHVHKPWTVGGFSMNVAAENIGYTPIPFGDVHSHFYAMGWTPDWVEFSDEENED